MPSSGRGWRKLTAGSRRVGRSESLTTAAGQGLGSVRIEVTALIVHLPKLLLCERATARPVVRRNSTRKMKLKLDNGIFLRMPTRGERITPSKSEEKISKIEKN
jgi:hypothetical protein